MDIAEAIAIRARLVKGWWVCWTRGYHLDGSTIGHWDDVYRCRDCRVHKGTRKASRWPYNRPWGGST